MKRADFCDGWEFSREEAPFAPVVIPHDAMLGGKRSAEAPGASASGYYEGTSCRYRKRFTLSAEQAASTILLEFEGLYRDARLTVNGRSVDVPPYGFIPFYAELTGLVQEGANLIEVHAGNADQPDCRWYSGAGIHRPVWLWEGGHARIAPEGVRVTTESALPSVIRVDVECTAGVPFVRVLDHDGAVVASGTGAHLRLHVPDAHLWDVDDPYLYRCSVELMLGGAVVDTASARFGIRTLEWGARGLFVNGRETLLRGGCIHSDNGVIGAMSFPAVERRRVRLLKDAGFNAVRMAHNPASAALLDACDELGMYVMDEAWDTWFTRKSAHDYSRHFLDWLDFDLTRLASRDYNHPSVIMYSIGNEVADPLAERGVALERSMVDLLHSVDPTRPVTCGLNLTMMVMERMGRGWYESADGVAEAASSDGAPRGSLLFNLAAQAAGSGMTLLANAPGADRLVSPALDALDIAGYNYASARYAIDARKHPGRIVVGTETFPHELHRNWALVERLPNLIGDFMWAGWDYLGEAGAGAWAYTAEEAGFSKPWPWLVAGSGALDLLGQPGAPAALAAAVWRTADAPSIQVRPVNVMNGKTYKATWRGSDAVPSWSWRGCEGTSTSVEVYDGRASSMRLYLNGVEVGRSRVRACVARFDVEYRPGTLEAVAFDGAGNELGRDRLASAEGKLRLSLGLDCGSVAAGDAAVVLVGIVGENGIVDSNADEQLVAAVEGGSLLGFGSAQPAPTERFVDGSYTTYRGRALAVVHRSAPGMATLHVSGRELEGASLEIRFAGKG